MVERATLTSQSDDIGILAYDKTMRKRKDLASYLLVRIISVPVTYSTSV
jgi:hypothetical protein